MRVFGVAAASVGLSLWATWPLAAHLATHVYDPGAHPGFVAESIRADVRLVLWILAWDVHALATAPLRLFDANIFHPAAHTLALSEHLLGALPVYAPLALGSGDPVLAHQATVLLTFVGAFGGAFALVHAWTGSTAGALLAGSLFAFSPFRGGHLGALQVLGNWWVPLVLLAAWRSVAGAGRLAPLALGATAALAALHSMYLAYAVFAGLGVLVATLLAADPGARARWRRLVLPLAAAGAVVAASAIPYALARASGMLAPPRGAFVEFASARPGRTGATVALMLTVATAPWWRRGLRARVTPAWPLALATAAATTHLLALGPTVRVAGAELPGPYRIAAAIVPGFASLRIPLRFDAFTTAAVAALAGIGTAGALAALGARRVRRAATAAIVLAAVAAARLGLPHPVPLEPIETRATLPPLLAALPSLPAGPLLELPWHDFDRAPRERSRDAVRVYRSVYHWRPLLNGYSGYAPPTYPLVGALAEALPAAEAARLLARTTGLRWVLVHHADLAPDARGRWEAAGAAGMRVARRSGTDVLLALDDPPAADLLPLLRAAPRGDATLTGTPLAALPPDARRAGVRGVLAVPRAVGRGQRLRVPLDVTNVSRARWPALTLADEHRVAVAARWEPAGGGPGVAEPVAGRIPWDLAPGEHARVVAVVTAPAAPGAWRLVLAPAQDGVPFDGAAAFDVEVR